MNNTPYLLKCPNCERTFDHQVRRDHTTLGSITSEGYIIIKQKFGRAVMVKAEEYSVICQCGYFVSLSHGRVTSDALTSYALNE